VSAPAPTASRPPAGEGRPARVLRLGAVSYLNAEPHVHGLEGERGIRLERDVPSRVAARLHAGEVDLAMIPSIEYLLGDYAIVPGIAIGSRGAVKSVRLFHALPLADLRRVAVDASSRTSAALVRLLLRERLGREPEYLSMAPALADMMAAADAALLIGDPALDEEGDLPWLDLGEEWTRTTGLPFVYAFWAGRPGSVTPEEVRRLQRALREGLEAIPAIAHRHAEGVPTRAAAYESYLRTNVVYRLEEEERAGLREFYRRAHALRLVPRVRELVFHADR